MIDIFAEKKLRNVERIIEKSTSSLKEWSDDSRKDANEKNTKIEEQKVTKHPIKTKKCNEIDSDDKSIFANQQSVLERNNENDNTRINYMIDICISVKDIDRFDQNTCNAENTTQ